MAMPSATAIDSAFSNYLTMGDCFSVEFLSSSVLVPWIPADGPGVTVRSGIYDQYDARGLFVKTSAGYDVYFSRTSHRQ
jgi:hypothetical protein